MALSPEKKAALKKYAESKSGRKNLKSLDHTLGLVGFDKAQDQDGARPAVNLRANGFMRYTEHGETHDGVAKGGFSLWVSCERVRSERLASSYTCPWVRLKHAADWQIEQLAKRWPSRKIAIRSYKGPTLGTAWETVTVHPVDVVIAWFRFLWPEPEEWGERAKKYLVGYTERMIHDFPGVGAKVLVRSCMDIPAGWGVLPIETTIEELSDVYLIQGRALFRGPDFGNDGSLCQLDQKLDKWDVIG